MKKIILMTMMMGTALCAMAAGNSCAPECAPCGNEAASGCCHGCRGYTLVWNDEFDSPIDSAGGDKWIYSPRKQSTWSCRNSPIPDLYEVTDGVLTLYARPDSAEGFITAAIETTGKFAFTHGLVEARIKINPHTGNFPAFWMMPDDRRFNGGWPHCGEIDIMEQIDCQTRTFHTLHAYWTKDKSRSVHATHPVDLDVYHVYALEWTPDSLVWLVDGSEVFRFDRADYGESDYAYPFDRPFHLILNQAVGDGSWAAPYDPEHTYSMHVDYVRVYRR